ncbi:MAG: zinc-binding dehydrogenase [Balneolales bacterium]
MDTELKPLAKVPGKKKLMQAAIIAGPGKIIMQTVAVPKPAADEISIRMEGCGLCASNLSPWEGREWFSYPMEAGSPGHEGWGTVEAVGKDVQSLKPGDRVTALSYQAYADYDVAKATHAVKLPKILAGLPFPGEPLGCAMNIFQRSQVKAGMTVAIIGVGFLGSLLVQLAKSAGARVIAISRSPSSLETAKKFNADEVILFKEGGDIVKQVEALTDSNLCQRVIEATGKQGPLDLAAQLTAEKGRLIIAGYHQDGQRQVNMQLWNWRGIDVINAHERHPMEYIKGIKRAVKAVEQEVIKPFPLFTHTFSKNNIQQAFKIHQQKPEGFMKALISFL